MLRDARHCFRIFGGTWLFYEKQVEWLNFSDHDGSHCRAHLGVEVYRNIDGVAQSFANALHRFDSSLDLGVGFNPFVIVIRKSDLQARNAGFESAFAQVCQVFSSADALDVIVAADTALVVGAAKQLVYGNSKSFAADIPQSL